MEQDKYFKTYKELYSAYQNVNLEKTASKFDNIKNKQLLRATYSNIKSYNIYINNLAAEDLFLTYLDEILLNKINDLKNLSSSFVNEINDTETIILNNYLYTFKNMVLGFKLYKCHNYYKKLINKNYFLLFSDSSS